MKSIVVCILFVTTIAWIGHAQNQSGAAKHEPNGGYVSDAGAAKEVAKVVLSRLLTPEDFRRKLYSDAVLKDGVWTVTYWEPKSRLNAVVLIQIRQKSGAVMKYEDPNV
jgi:hypothetical protein